MSDIRPGPATRRLECYRLAVTLCAPMVGMHKPFGGKLDARSFSASLHAAINEEANYLHQQIYGGPLPPVETTEEPKRAGLVNQRTGTI